ncbi:MAG: hypothetical protein ACK45X_08800, partial [Roseiflexaceae bacterium]
IAHGVTCLTSSIYVNCSMNGRGVISWHPDGLFGRLIPTAMHEMPLSQGTARRAPTTPYGHAVSCPIMLPQIRI